MKETVQDSRSLLNQMKVYGEEISDKNIFVKVFISLLENFDPIVTVIEQTMDISQN